MTPSLPLRYFIVLVWLGCLALVAAVWGATATLIRSDEQDAMARAERDTANLARIIAGQTERAIAGNDQILRFLAYDLQTFGAYNPNLRDVVKNATQKSDILVQLSYVDERGDLIQTSIDGPPPKINVADREHFAVHRDNPDVGLFISKPVFGRASGKWSIQLTRRIFKPDGSFGGVMVASIDPFYFSRSFDALDVGEGGIISIVGYDGILRARSVLDEQIIGRDISASETVQAARKAGAGFLRARSSIDGVLRLQSFRAVPGYPLFVIAGFSEETFMAEVRARRSLYLASAGAFTVTLLAMAFVIARHATQQAKANALIHQGSLELQRSEARYRTMFATVAQPVVTTDDQGVIDGFNPAAERLFGYRADEVIGRNVAVLMPAAFAGRHEGYVRDYRASGRDRPVETLRELVGRRRDGTEFPLEIALSNWRVDGRQFFTGIVRDVTGPKQVEENLRRARDSADRANRMKGEFLAIMSHEIRTPMNGILGTLELLDDTELTGEQKRFVGMARRSGQALLSILNDILDLAKLEAGKIEIDPVDFDLSQLLADVTELLMPHAREKGLELSWSAAADVPAAVLADRGRLRQILFNLVGNAIKFTSAGRVTVRVAPQPLADPDTPDELELRFEVEDTGIGIPPDLRDRLFQRFSQADSSTTRRFGGTGLGLAICRELSTLMGGRIDVDSEPGRGSTFWFTIRCRPGTLPAVGAADAAAVPALPLLPPLRILAVEDNLVNRDILVTLLRRQGHEVEEAANGREAVEAVRRQRFDVVLMDIQMPEMDGLTATRLIRGLGGAEAATPIVALTANAMKGHREEYLAAGMDDYVTKPIRPAALVAAMARVVRRDGAAPAPATAPTAPEEPAAGWSGAPLLDREQIEAMREALGPEGWQVAVDGFSGPARQLIAALRASVAQPGATAPLAHTLKGMAASVGAERLAALAAEIERLARAGAPPDRLAVAAAPFDALLDETAEAMVAEAEEHMAHS